MSEQDGCFLHRELAVDERVPPIRYHGTVCSGLGFSSLHIYPSWFDQLADALRVPYFIDHYCEPPMDTHGEMVKALQVLFREIRYPEQIEILVAALTSWTGMQSPVVSWEDRQRIFERTKENPIITGRGSKEE